MSELQRDAVRDLIESSTALAPSPVAWAEVERRAHDLGQAAAPRRSARPLVAAAAVALVVAGFALIVVMRDAEPTTVTRVDQPAPPESEDSAEPTASVTTTQSPTTTIAVTWSGGLIDEIDETLLSPLLALGVDDVVVPTAPASWRVADSAAPPASERGASLVDWTLEVTQARADGVLGHILYVTLSQEPFCNSTLGCIPTGEAEMIEGITWEVIGPQRPVPDDDVAGVLTLRAAVGGRWLSVMAGAPQAVEGGGNLLDDEMVRVFLGGLRAGPADAVVAVGEACRGCDGVNGNPFDPLAAATALSEEARAVAPDPAGAVPVSVPPRLGAVIEGATARPLAEFAEGDLLVPTYVPPSMEQIGLDSHSAFTHGDGSVEYTFGYSRPDGDEESRLAVRHWAGFGLDSAVFTDPNHPPIEVAGVTWGWLEFEQARIAEIGPTTVWVWASNVDPLEALWFVEGLRAVAVEDPNG